MPEVVSSIVEKPLLADWTGAIRRSALQDMLVEASRPGILSLALGLPAPELFPTTELSRAASHVLAQEARALQYSPPLQTLKRQVVELMARRDVKCREEQIFLTAGAQQGISLLTRLLLNPGGRVLTEELTYTGFQQVLQPFQPQILTVPTDLLTGMDVEAVEGLLDGGERPAFIYTVTNGHNPLGVSISLEKRARLVQLAERYRIPIIEDDPYGFLYYEGAPVPPLRSFSETWVYHVGSFSKILAPALRAGWLVVPEEMIPHLAVLKESSDIDTTTFSQRVISNYLAEENLDTHLLNLRREYRLRRDTMLEALEKNFPAKARWHRPACGFFIWVELPEAMDTTHLLKIALETEQVAFIPGSAFSVHDSGQATNCLRLNYSNATPARITDAITRLGRVLNSQR
jgi:2-aminoadipate transaminase